MRRPGGIRIASPRCGRSGIWMMGVVRMVSLKHWQLSRDELTKMGVKLPSFDVDATRAAGARQPAWIHFGGGNLYRAFHAEIAQDVMDAGGLDRGVVVVETFSPFTVDEVYAPYDENILQVIMHEDGALEERVLASTAASLFCNPKRPDDYAQVQKYSRATSCSSRRSPSPRRATRSRIPRASSSATSPPRSRTAPRPRRARWASWPRCCSPATSGCRAHRSRLDRQLLAERPPLPRRRAHHTLDRVFRASSSTSRTSRA